MSDEAARQSLALTTTLGLGDFGKEVAAKIRSFHSVLPDVLRQAWEILPLDSCDTDQSKGLLGQSRRKLLRRENTTRILESGYDIEGRKGQMEIRIKNVYVWDTAVYGNSIPTIVSDSIKERPGEMHVAFCYESDDTRVPTDSFRVPTALSYYLIEDTLHTGEVINRQAVVSSVAGVILTGFLPNSEFNLADRRGSISTIGFAGRYGLIWDSNSCLADLLGRRISEYQLSKSQQEIARGPIPGSMTDLVNSVDPCLLGKRLFHPEAAGILESQGIPAVPEWQGDTLQVNMNQETLAHELHDYDKPQWPNQIRLFARAFSMTLGWKWRRILHRAAKRLEKTVLNKFTKNIRNILDTGLFAPGKCAYICAELEAACDRERRAMASRSSALDTEIRRLKRAIESQPHPICLILRTALWLIPVVSVLSLSIYWLYALEEGAGKGILLSVLAGIALLVASYLYIYKRVGSSEDRVLDAREAALSTLTLRESSLLSISAISELEELVSSIRLTRDRAMNDVNSYKLNLNSLISLYRDRSSIIADQKYSVLHPIINTSREYEHLFSDYMNIDVEYAASTLLKTTDTFKGLYAETVDTHDLFEEMHSYCLQMLDDSRLVARRPTVRELMTVKDRVGEEQADLDKLLVAAIEYAVPMTSRDRIGSTELTIGVPADLIKGAQRALQKSSSYSSADILDMGEYQFVFCISRAVIESDGNTQK